MRKRLACVVLTLGFAGCATGNQIHYSNEGPAVFGGLRMVGAIFGADHMTGGDVAMAILDAPLSLVGDVMLLPFSIINEIYHDGINVDPPPPPPLSVDLRKYGAEHDVFLRMKDENKKSKWDNTIR